MLINTKNTELNLTIEAKDLAAVFTDAANEINRLSDMYLSVVPDPTTKNGYEFCKEVRAEMMPLKKALESARKNLKAPVLTAGKLIDSTINPLIKSVDDVYKPFENAYRLHDKAIQQKKERDNALVDDKIKEFESTLFQAIGQTASYISVIIEDLADFDADSNIYKHRTDEVLNKYIQTMNKLNVLLTDAQNQPVIEVQQNITPIISNKMDDMPQDEVENSLSNLTEYQSGFIDGITMYAHFVDGVGYIGHHQTPLNQAISDLIKGRGNAKTY